MNSTGITYLNIWYNYILEPIINYEYSELFPYIDNNEGEIFKIMYPHDGTHLNFQLCRLPQIFPFTVYIVPFLIQIICGFSIGWFLYITLQNICGKRKKPLGKVKCFWILRLKFLLAFLILILLCATALATFKISFLLDRSLRNAIKTGSNVVNNVRNEKTTYELQLSKANESVVDTILSIENAVNNLPDNIYNSTYEIVKMEFVDGTGSYNEIMMKTNFIYEHSGLKKIHDQVEQILEKELKITDKLMNMFNQNIDILLSNVTNDLNFENKTKETILHDINSIKSYSKNFRGKYKFTNWTNVYKILDETYNKILPNVNTSMHFIDKYPTKIKYSIKPNSNQIRSTLKKFRNQIEFIINKLRNIVRQIFHSHAAGNIRKLVEYSIVTEDSINRNITFGCRYLYPSTLLFLVPFFHTFLYLFCMIQCIIWATYQVYYNFRKKKPTSDVPCFKVVSEMGLMLLWTGLSLSVLCYLGALALSSVCRPLHTQRLYTRYIDNLSEWNNKTWLDAVVYPWNHNYKLKNVLEKCSDNVTIYQAFEVDEYWNVSTEFQNFKVNADNSDWIRLIKNAVNDVELPTGQSCIEARDNFNIVEQDLAHCSSYIIDDVELFENVTFETFIQNITKKYSATPIHDKLSQSLDIFHFIKNQNLGYLLNNFMEFKYLLKSNQNHLNNIKKFQDQIVNKLQQKMDSIIKYEVDKMENYVNDTMYNTEKDLSYKAEHEYGNCQYYSTAMRIIQITICGDLPLILNMAWIIFVLNAILMLMSIALARNLANDVARLRQEYRKTLKREAHERMLKHRQRLMDGTLLFDRRGQVLGGSRTLVNEQQ